MDPTNFPPKFPQYPLKPEAKENLNLIIEDLYPTALVTFSISPHNAFNLSVLNKNKQTKKRQAIQFVFHSMTISNIFLFPVVPINVNKFCLKR